MSNGAIVSMTVKEAEKRSEMTESNREGTARNAESTGTGAAAVTATKGTPERYDQLLSRIVERTNMQQAYHRVVQNRGAAGVDGMSVAELKEYLVKNWLRIKELLLTGKYIPQAVRGVQIPKPTGGVRQLGIPTAVDRLIQQAMHQVLSPIFDPTFSDRSYGFRPGRSAHQAVLQARQYVADGYRFVVDMDAGEILRPGESRHSDVAPGAENRGQTASAAGPALPSGREACKTAR